MNIVMTFGTFDKLHPGHISYLEQARKYGDYLMVVVARDKNVFSIKGKLPRDNEKTRLKKVKKLDFVDFVRLGLIRNKFGLIVNQKPDVICLGYDQKVDLKELKKVFKGRIVRLKAFKPEVYKSSLL